MRNTWTLDGNQSAGNSCLVNPPQILLYDGTVPTYAVWCIMGMDGKWAGMKTRGNKPFRESRSNRSALPADSDASSLDTIFRKAVAHHQAGELAQAKDFYSQVLQASPQHSDALHLLGVMACSAGQFAVALKFIDKAIQSNPQLVEYHSNRAFALRGLRQYQAALESSDKAIGLQRDHVNGWINRGSSLLGLSRHQAAIDSFDQAARINPGAFDAYIDRGIALHCLHRYREALQNFETAIQRDSNSSAAFNNRGNTLLELRHYRGALESFTKAIQLQPDSVPTHNSKGVALLELGQYEAALESFDKTLQLDQSYAKAHLGRGVALLEVQQHEAATDSFRKAMNLEPGMDYLGGFLLHSRQFLCDWEGIETQIQELEVRVERGNTASMPFPLVAFSNSAALQRKAAEIFVGEKFFACDAELPRRKHRERICIGYYSADFYNHATSYLIAELFERHDRSRFEIIAFSFGPTASDAMRERIQAAVERFVDVSQLTDSAVAQMSREMGVDIAVDLKGYTMKARTGIFAERAAPLQVSYLGYPGTMGAEFIDYLIADHTVISAENLRHYTEKIAFLPGSYQVNDSRRPISTKKFQRGEQGLPEQGFVYCSFNNNYKIMPRVFALWMRILRAVEGSVLWMLEGDPCATANLRREAERQGVAAERLVFARRLPLDEHLGRHALADLLLDTLPCNAHTTASDALWAGLPVLTQIGETFAGRVAASLLRAIELPELIVKTEQEYEELAIALARDPLRLQSLRQRLQQNRLSAPLFQTDLYARHLESAYAAMMQRYEAGLAPEHLDISGDTAADLHSLDGASAAK
jgi:predicted O-linked N-acetylglucosamine transferase (SPINDLY family)